MSRRTKKVGVAGKFGPRYGVRARNMYAEVMTKKNAKYRCENCGYNAVKRTDTGIWSCRHCGYTFAGGAYTPKTQIVSNLITAGAEGEFDNLKEGIAEARAREEEKKKAKKVKESQATEEE